MTFQTILTPETVGEYTAAGYWSDRIITDFLDEAADRTPDKTAAIDARRQVTYAELVAEVDRAALGFLELGVRPGDVISFQLPNWIEFLVVHFAATRIGAVSNPLIPIYRDREVGFMVTLAESKLIVIPAEFRGYDYPAMVDRLARNGLRCSTSWCWAASRPRPGRGRSSRPPRGSSAGTRRRWPRCGRTRTRSPC